MGGMKREAALGVRSESDITDRGEFVCAICEISESPSAA